MSCVAPWILDTKASQPGPRAEVPTNPTSRLNGPTGICSGPDGITNDLRQRARILTDCIDPLLTTWDRPKVLQEHRRGNLAV